MTRWCRESVGERWPAVGYPRGRGGRGTRRQRARRARGRARAGILGGSASAGVRRIFAVFVKKGEVCEWFPEKACFVPLDLDGTIEDRTLVCPVPVRALFDTAVADDSLVDALEAKGNPRLAKRVATGFAEGLRRAVQTACTLLGIPLGPHERDHLDSLDVDGLESLLVHLETERRWPSR